MPESGVRFHELMKGWIAVPESNFRDSGKAWCELCAEISIRDLNAFLVDPSHRGQLVGNIDLDPIGHNIPAKGYVELFTRRDDFATRLMRYYACFVVNGVEHKFIGTKHVSRAEGANVWSHTTTLFTTIVQRGVDRYEPIAAGIIRLSGWQGVRMLFTLRGTGSGSLTQRMNTVFRFMRFFITEIFAAYFSLRG